MKDATGLFAKVNNNGVPLICPVGQYAGRRTGAVFQRGGAGYGLCRAVGLSALRWWRSG